MKEKGHKILTPLTSLDTPGKATVEVVILADPVRVIFSLLHLVHVLKKYHYGDRHFYHLVQDGHEICFVGDEAFRELSQVDPKADELIDKAMKEDKSEEWYSKKGKSKDSA